MKSHADIPKRSRTSARWTSEEDVVLTTQYAAVGAEGIREQLPSRSLHAIRSRAELLGLIRSPAVVTALRMVQIRSALRAHRGCVADAASTLGVPVTSLQRRAEQMGLCKATAHPHWSGTEISKLRAVIAAGAKPDASNFPGRSPNSIRAQADRLRAAARTNAAQSLRDTDPTTISSNQTNNGI